jgi:PAS domain S-box-containing protein
MKYSLSGKSLTEAGDHVKLPGLLKKYASSDFTTQQKTRFIFYFCITAIAAIAFFIIAAIYIQLIGEEYGGIYLPVILPELAVMLLFIGCLFLLIKGFYGLASHLLIASGILCVWLVMWVDRGSTVTRLDTIVIIVALLNLAPLFITKYKSAIVFYILVNLVLLLVFLLVFHDQMNLSHAGMIDYFIDTSLAMIFTGIVGYAIFDINKKVLNKALVEIEERRQIEKALVSSEKKYREMTELLPQTIFEADLNGNITYVNKSGYAMFGYDQEDVERGINLYSIILMEERETARKNIQSIIHGQPVQGREYTAMKKDGTYFPIQTFSSLRVEDQKPAGLRGIIVDISERKRSEEALRKSESLMAEVLNGIPLPTFILDGHGNFLYLNKALEKVYNKPVNELLGNNAFELMPPEIREQRRAIIESVFVNNKAVNFDDHNQDKYYTNYIYPIPDISGRTNHVIVFMLDISKRKKLERELEKHRDNLEFLVKERTEELAAANEKLNSTNELLYSQREALQDALDKLRDTQNQLIQSEKMASLGVLSAGIAHEINNPLNFIHGGISGIKTYFSEKLNDHLQQVEPLIEAINEGVKRASDIVESLSHYSRQDDLPKTDCDLHAIIDNCLVMLRSELRNKAEVKKHYTPQSYTVSGSEGKLHQAVLNILANAEQSITKSGTITIRTEVSANMVVLTIADSGAGISQENLPRIFDPFFTTKPPGKGTGLGLSITYNIIREHRGTIAYESQPGRGTKATIMLPIHQTGQARL